MKAAKACWWSSTLKSASCTTRGKRRVSLPTSPTLSSAHALAGAATNWCIRATAYAALERGYTLTLLSDAHTTAAMDLGGGVEVDPAQGVHDLNTVMRWLSYPNRTCRRACNGQRGPDTAAGPNTSSRATCPMATTAGWVRRRWVVMA